MLLYMNPHPQLKCSGLSPLLKVLFESFFLLFEDLLYPSPITQLETEDPEILDIGIPFLLANLLLHGIFYFPAKHILTRPT
ncbi:hypothetical protein D3C75_782000 [compost metagenome]